MPIQKSKTEAIKRFEEIRNIPYHISIDGEKGYNCENKAKMLVEELKRLGFEARIRVGLFCWSTLDLPVEVSQVSHDDDCSHMFVDFKNSDGNWVSIDPTWNPELEEAGFKIAYWDGEKSTDLAIECHTILLPEESEKYLQKIDYVSDLQRNGEFYKALNAYCDSLLLEKK